MPAYHSTFIDSSNYKVINNIPLIPLDTNQYDITDEVLDLFKSNTFFKNFEFLNHSDRLLTYGILYINSLLMILNPNINKNDATRKFYNYAIDNNIVPGDVNFKLNNMFMIEKNNNRSEMEELKQYLQAFRITLANKLITKVYTDFKDPSVATDKPNKFWLQFNKRKFMNKSL